MIEIGGNGYSGYNLCGKLVIYQLISDLFVILGDDDPSVSRLKTAFCVTISLREF
jgi:hypothetical protein